MSGYQGPGRYRHYKGGEYEVLGLAIHEEAKEVVFSDESEVTFEGAEMRVIYRPLSPGSILERLEDAMWGRLLEDFNAIVELPPSMTPGVSRVARFEKIT